MNHRTTNLRMILMAAVVLVGALMLALGATQAMAQGIPILYCSEQDPETARCDGTDATESLVGQDTRDVIRAFAGDDIINAERGRDDAFGGPGARDAAFFDVNRRTGQSDTVADNCEFRNEIPGS